MKLLAIETSSSACSIALFNSARKEAEQYFSSHRILPMQQSQHILSMIDALLSSANMAMSELDAIAYGCGPGSFTGIRLANSIAQAIGYGLNIPLISVSSLAAMAVDVFEKYLDCETVAVCVDARAGKVYWATYHLPATGSASLKAHTNECLTMIKDIPDDDVFKSSQKILYGTGDGWVKYKQELDDFLPQQPNLIISSALPHALGVLKLARMKFEQQLFIEAKHALPVYLQ